MNILYLTAGFPFGDGESFIGDEIDGIASLGVQVTVVPVRPRSVISSRAGGEGNINIGRFSLLQFQYCFALLRLISREPIKAFNLFCLVLRAKHLRNKFYNLAVLPKAVWLTEWTKREKVEHIHAHWGTAPATMALMISYLSKIPWSMTCHRYDIVADNLLAVKLSKASFSRFISSNGFDMARAIVGADLVRSKVLHMGVRVPECVADGRPRNSLTVLCPAGLLPVKGHSVLLQAIARCLMADVPVDLYLAGSGPEQTALELLAVSLRIAQRVHFLGHLTHVDLLDWYIHRRVSAVVLASLDLGNGLHEGIPVALMEAMAHRIPVVSTRTGGIPELLEDGAGLLVSPNSPDDLAEALATLWREPAFADALAERGRTRIELEFNRDRICEQLVVLFRSGGCPI